jgi:hypothetical protein
MITIRQIERLFNDQQWSRLLRELLANRPENPWLSDATECDEMRHFSRECAMRHPLAAVVPIAALAMIRLDELNQAGHPFYRRLLNVILTSQQKDGGWGDLLVTSLCVRALIAGAGSGVAIEGGLGFLAALQKTEGSWPKDPIRRLPADGYTTAFILHQLGEFSAFRDAVRFHDAITWFTTHSRELDEPTQRLWSHARTRCRLATTYRPAPLFSPRAA